MWSITAPLPTSDSETMHLSCLDSFQGTIRTESPALVACFGSLWNGSTLFNGRKTHYEVPLWRIYNSLNFFWFLVEKGGEISSVFSVFLVTFSLVLIFIAYKKCCPRRQNLQPTWQSSGFRRAFVIFFQVLGGLRYQPFLFCLDIIENHFW